MHPRVPLRVLGALLPPPLPLPRVLDPTRSAPDLTLCVLMHGRDFSQLNPSPSRLRTLNPARPPGKPHSHPPPDAFARIQSAEGILWSLLVTVVTIVKRIVALLNASAQETCASGVNGTAGLTLPIL